MCSIIGCERNVKARGLCKTHYERLRRWGNTDPKPVVTASERFWRSFTVHVSGCWLWTGELSHNGYGRVHITRSSRMAAHKWIYEQTFGTVPDGFQLDHLCKTKNCVNVEHLEVVTPSENNLRKHAVATCRRGHLWSENTYISPRGTRNCRACRNEATQRYRERH